MITIQQKTPKKSKKQSQSKQSKNTPLLKLSSESDNNMVISDSDENEKEINPISPPKITKTPQKGMYFLLCDLLWDMLGVHGLNCSVKIVVMGS